MRAHVDDRVTAIARMIRSDNQALAERMEQPAPANDDAELLRQTLRSIKELHAGLANDVLSSVDRRFQSMSDQLHKEIAVDGRVDAHGGGAPRRQDRPMSRSWWTRATATTSRSWSTG